jgi:peroxiredoxin
MICLLRLFTFWTLTVIASTTIPAGATILNAKPVPEVSFNTLDGASLTLSTLRGTVMLINFWGTWCAPCLQEIPELVYLSNQFKARGFEVVGIAVSSGSVEDIRGFMREHQMDYRVLIGKMAILKRQFRVVGFPTSLLVDRQGIIRECYFGPQTKEILKKDVESLLE